MVKLIKTIEKKDEDGKLIKNEYEINATEEQAKVLLKDPRIREAGRMGFGKTKESKPIKEEPEKRDVEEETKTDE